MKVVKNHGGKEEFDEEKLFNSVYYPAKEGDFGDERSKEIAEKVIWEIKAWMSEHEDTVFSWKEIRGKVVDILEREEEDVAFLYNTHLDLN